tara:strand:- start:184 stop:1155 length:972 start_codon:yes stop_codon:yes gene_type:complete
MSSKKFLIPDGIEYYTGVDASLLEKLKLSVIKIFKKYKYDFVVTPVIDSIDNLNNLNDFNYKNLNISLSDRRELAIRSDITPQISRLDYQSNEMNKSNKYSYMGDIYRETRSPFDRNIPLQAGAEYFGKLSKNIDVTLIKMCYEIISLAKSKRIIIELNDSYFINHYLESLKLINLDKNTLKNLINLKSIDEINNFFKIKKLSQKKLNELLELMTFDGPVSMVKDINIFCKKYKYNCKENIKLLTSIIKDIKSLKNVELVVDICSFRSMDYEKSFNYAFYVENFRKAIALGGRYISYKLNNGTVRTATGFSIDLKDIIMIYEK